MANDQHSVALTPPTATAGWLMNLDGNGNLPAGQYPEIPVGYKHKADITFTINNPSGQNVVFANNPILVPAKDKVFDVPVINSPTSFTITDKNPDAARIPYVLLFNGGAPKLDPIIDNGGGNIMMPSNLHLLEAAGGLFLALVIGMWVQKTFRLFG